jgi:hypothetical protein
MAITTKDCINYIIIHWWMLGSIHSIDNLKSSNWKRISKSGNKQDGFIRTFLNKKTNIVLDVHSTDKEICNVVLEDFSSLPKVPKGKYLFYLTNNLNQGWNPDNDCEKGTIVVTISSKKEWEDNKACSDHYEDDEWEDLDPIIYAFNLEEIMESTFLVNRISIEKLRRKFLAVGFEEDIDFNNAMSVWDKEELE